LYKISPKWINSREFYVQLLLLYTMFKTRIFQIKLFPFFKLNICVFKSQITVLVAVPVKTTTNHSAHG